MVYSNFNVLLVLCYNICLTVLVVETSVFSGFALEETDVFFLLPLTFVGEPRAGWLALLILSDWSKYFLPPNIFLGVLRLGDPVNIDECSFGPNLLNQV